MPAHATASSKGSSRLQNRLMISFWASVVTSDPGTARRLVVVIGPPPHLRGRQQGSQRQAGGIGRRAPRLPLMRSRRSHPSCSEYDPGQQAHGDDARLRESENLGGYDACAVERFGQDLLALAVKGVLRFPRGLKLGGERLDIFRQSSIVCPHGGI